MREEPVLFVAKDGDFVPYTIKEKGSFDDYIVTGKLVKEADHFEANIRKEVDEIKFLRNTLLAHDVYIRLHQRRCITKTRLFKYIEKFTTKQWKLSDKKILVVFIFLLKK